jgi:hypothetical protein
MATVKDVLMNMALRFSVDAANMNKEMTKVTSKMNVFKSGLKALGTTIAAAFSVYAIKNFLQTSLQALDAQLKAEQSLLVALKGRRDIQQTLIQQASNLQSKTLYGDEETIAAYSRLAQMIGANEDALKRLMPLVQDFATAKGMDLAGAADLVAKALGSSTNALARYGIQIKGEVGSVERLETAVTQLNKAFGGQAQAAAAAGLGVVQQAQNYMGDIKENIVKVLLPMVQQSAQLFKEWGAVMTSPDLSKWEKFLATISNAAKHNLYKELGFDEINEVVDSEAMKKFTAYMESKSPIKNLSLGGTEAVEEINDQIVEQIPLLEQAKAKLDEYTEAWNNAITEEELAEYGRKIQLQDEEIKRLQSLGKVTDEYIQKQKELLQQQELLEYRKAQLRLAPYTEMASIGYGVQGPLPNPEAANAGLKGIDYSKQIQQTQQLTEQMAYLNEMNYVLEASFAELGASVASAFGEMITTGEFGTDQLISVIANMAEQLGKLAISMGVAALGIDKALKTPASGYVAIAAGAALVALAAAVKSSLSNISSGGSGAVSSYQAPTSSGGGGGYDFMRQFQQLDKEVVYVEVTGTIEGENIRLSNKRAEIRHRSGY